ncbi:MAG TPA: YtxH domain-containing protein [Bacteroidia bacterium]|nr:YtxH domain-containing protein [Bacteroidia bacterium]
MNNSETQHTGYTGKIIGALLVGTIVGAGLALLFNSESGNEMKEKLTSEIKEALDGLKDKMKSEHCQKCGCKKEEESAKQA